MNDRPRKPLETSSQESVPTVTSIRTPPRHVGVVAAGIAIATLVLSACGGTSANHASTSNASTNASSSGSSDAKGGGLPRASGQVAAISGSSMEVQNPQTGQTTVNWTASTTFTKTVTVSASAVAPGACMTVIGSTASGHLIANTVMITQPDSSGSCTARFRSGGGGGEGFRSGTAPGGGTPNRPNGSLPAGAANFGFASGKVTSVSPTSLVVYGISSTGFGARGRGSTPPTSIPASSITITLSSTTIYSETQPAAASDLAVNDCVTANGTADTTGAITARTIRITSTGGQTCTGRFPTAGELANG